METYLAQLRKVLENIYSNSDHQLHVVIGNESCDLDSAVSALVFAYFMQWKEKDARPPVAYVPVLNIRRDEYRLRTEVRYVLSELFGSGVENWLIFIDEIRLDALYAANRLSLTLVDHHKLSTAALTRYGPIVRRVIDHHVDNEPEHSSYRKQCDGREDGFNRYVTDTVGSCSTLVAERITNISSGRSSESILDEKVSKLLLSAILIDTSDLKDSVKTTPRDVAMVEKLETVLLPSGRYNRKLVFEGVKRAKTDVAAMTVLEILAKDYKAIRRAANATGPTTISSIGMSTVPLSFEALASHIPDGQTASSPVNLQLETFRQQKQVDALVLSCVDKEPDVPKGRKKQVVVYGGDDADKDRIYSALSTIMGLDLTSALVGGDNGVNAPMRVYWQGNPGLSRKQMLPALENLLNGKLGGSEENATPVTSPSKSGQSTPSSPDGAADGSGGGGQSDQSAESKPSPDRNAQAAEGSQAVGGQQQGTTTGSKAKRFLDSTDLARSFSVTYDDDDAEDDYYLGGGSTHQEEQWPNGVRPVGHLGRIDENRLPSTALGDYELDHSDRPLDELSSYSPSTTEDEARHYPTVNTPYATSSYDGGVAVAGGSGNTQEESAATLSGVPDLLDSRENLADVVAGVAEDTPDLLVDYHSPSPTAEAPFPVSSKRAYDEYGDVDLLQGTEAVHVVRGLSGNDTVSSDSQTDDYAVDVNIVEPSFSSYPPDIAVNYFSEEKNFVSPTEHLKRELSEPQQFQFSSDPSPAAGRSRADTPPSSISRDEGDEDDLRSHGRKFVVGVDNVDDDSESLKQPGARTPPNTYAESYLDEAIATNETSGGRRASQQSELEPELLYLKLRGTQFSVKDELTAAASLSSGLLSQEGSVPATPPNSFMGTPVPSMAEMAAGGVPLWSAYQGRRGSQLEPENLRQRVTELKKNLPPEDVEFPEKHGALAGRRVFMDVESPALDSVAGIAEFGGSGVLAGDEYYQDRPSGISPSILDQFAEQLADTLLTNALAEVFYPEVADGKGFVNAAFSTGSTATPSPSSPVKNSGVFPDLNSAERSLPDVLSENFPSPPNAAPSRCAAKTPLSTRSFSDLLDASGHRGLPFDLVSCASAVSLGRESTVAHADSTEFNIAGRRAEGAGGMLNCDPRVQTDFNDEGEDRRDPEFADEEAASVENTGSGFGEECAFQRVISGLQWEEEGYPALVDIHQQDSSRLFSDEPGGFNEAVAVARPPSGGSGREETGAGAVPPSVSPASKKRKKTPAGDDQSSSTESGPDSPDTESADEQPGPEDGEGTSGVADKPGGDGLEWENDTPILSPQKLAAQQWAAAADMAEERRWRTVVINGENHRIDMAAVEPYRRVISHGGYYGEGLNAIAVFAACYLPSRSDTDYHYLMDNLFLYTVSMLDMLVADDYVIIYFQGGSTGDQMPPFSWLRKCYHLIDRRHVSHTEVGLDRRLRKNLKAIYLVHPTLWLKTVVTMTKPFISSKFSRKVYFIQALNDLGKLICMDQVEIPDEVLKHDHDRVFARTHTGSGFSGASAGRSASRRPTSAHDDGSNRRVSATATATATSTTESAER